MKPETLRWLLGGICAALFWLFLEVSSVQQLQASGTTTDSHQAEMLKEIRADIKEILSRLPARD